VNWEAIHVVATIVLALAGGANFFVLLQIDKRIAQAISDLKEWARHEFVTQREVDARLAAVERR
jgi:hypothetical protein